MPHRGMVGGSRPQTVRWQPVRRCPARSRRRSEIAGADERVFLRRVWRQNARPQCSLSRPSRRDVAATLQRTLEAPPRRGAAPDRASGRAACRRGSRRAASSPPPLRRRRGLTWEGSALELGYVGTAPPRLAPRAANSPRAAAGRRHTYLRISLTERCSLRCTCCIYARAHHHLPHRGARQGAPPHTPDV